MLFDRNVASHKFALAESLLEVGGTDKATPSEVRAQQLGAGGDGPGQVRSGEVHIGEIRAGQIPPKDTHLGVADSVQVLPACLPMSRIAPDDLV